MRKLLEQGVLCLKPGMEEKLRSLQSSLVDALGMLPLQDLSADANDGSAVATIRARTVEIDQAMKEQRAFVKREDVRKAGGTPIALGLSSTSD